MASRAPTHREVGLLLAIAAVVGCGAGGEGEASTSLTGGPPGELESTGAGDPEDTGTDTSDDASTETETESELHCSIDVPFEQGPPTDEPSALVDFVAMELAYVIDASAHTIVAQAQLRFTTGDSELPPLIDLRQQPQAVVVDGRAVDPALFPLVDLEGNAQWSMRRLDVELSPCEEHTLELEYALDTPLNTSSLGADPPGPDWDVGSVLWQVEMSDDRPGRYLESWAPSNLVFDTFELDVTMEVVGTSEPHTLWTNGRGDSNQPGTAWTFSHAAARATSPYWFLMPQSRVTSAETRIVAALDGDVQVTVVVVDDPNLEAAELTDAIESWLDEHESALGSFPHDEFLAVVVPGTLTSGGGGMEYPGAATTQAWALEHELIHSWIGRGVHPLTDANNWVDEALTVYYEERSEGFELLTLDSPLTLTLVSSSPWARGYNPDAAYVIGPRMMNAIAEEHGVEAFDAAVRELLLSAGATGTYTTESVQLILEDELGVSLAPWFDKFVYGYE